MASEIDDPAALFLQGLLNKSPNDGFGESSHGGSSPPRTPHNSSQFSFKGGTGSDEEDEPDLPEDTVTEDADCDRLSHTSTTLPVAEICRLLKKWKLFRPESEAEFDLFAVRDTFFIV